MIVIITIGMFIISLVFLIIFDIKLAIGMLVFSVILYLLASLFAKKPTSFEKEISDTSETFTTDMSTTFNGLKILKLNNIEDKF